jgi:cardiolipin synthase
MVQHAGHRNFEKLLRCGVRLFEYPHTLLHQKVMTVDGVWSAIGSSNFDDRSFETNDELTLSIRDEALARRLDAIFEKYVVRATEVDLERWRKRALSHKLTDRFFYTLNELL